MSATIAPFKSKSTQPATPARTRVVLPPARWKIKTRPEARDETIANACDLSPVTAAILRARGYDSVSSVEKFLSHEGELHDPFTLPDMAIAVERLHRAISARESFLIFGDYDVDGVTSTALLMRSLQKLGADVRAQVPERRDGYSLSIPAVEAAHARGQKLILTADCGITAHAAISRARELGIDVIVTDHHEPDGTNLPSALAVVNPKRLDSQYAFREICGCAVAFKTMQALLETHWPRAAASFHDKYVELVALATIADCMPLENENRVLARDGLRRLATTKKSGLRALIKSSRLQVHGDSLRGGHIGFSLAPRLNAAGRFDQAIKSLQLLMSSDETDCERLAGELEEHNRDRQLTTTRIVREATELLHEESDLTQDCAIVLAGRNWPRGMVGLVASRLAEKYSRPAIVLGIHNGVAGGSGRSIAGFDLTRVLNEARHLISGGGGHAGACGVHLDEKNVAAFRDKVLCVASEQLKIADLTPVIEADCEVGGTDLSAQLVRDLEKLEPCGKGNAEPILVLSNAEIVDGKSMGADGVHLKWRVRADNRVFEAVWWRPGEKAMGFGLGKRVDLCFVPELNVWNGNTTLQLNIKEARLSHPSR